MTGETGEGLRGTQKESRDAGQAKRMRGMRDMCCPELRERERETEREPLAFMKKYREIEVTG